MRNWGLIGFFAFFAATIQHGPARAQPAGPTVHPIYAHLPGSAFNEQTQRLFSEAVARYGVGPVEVMDIPAPPAPKAAELLKTAMAAAEKLKFAEAESAIEAAAREARETGGRGLTAAELADLYLYQGIVAQRATWKDLEAPLKEIAPPAAKEAYLRAAVLTPERVLAPKRFPPLAIASMKLATAEVKQRPRGNVLVKAAPNAEVTVDAGDGRLPPANVSDLPYGEHLVRVEDVGHQPWVATVNLSQSVLEIDAPVTSPTTLDDREAATRAKRMGAPFALVASLKTGTRLELELALIDAVSGERRNSTVVPFGGEAGAIDAAVMRLDEEARRRDVEQHGEKASTGDTELAITTAPPAPLSKGARFGDNPGAWAHEHWPLLTAIGATVATAIVLGIAVGNDSRPPR